MTQMYRIRTKVRGFEGKAVKFNPNRYQRIKYNLVYRDRVRRIIELKSRKFGTTTGWAIDTLDEVAYGKENYHAVTMAHDEQKSAEIFNDIVKFAWDRIPKEIRPKQKYSNKTELDFTDTRGSKYTVTGDVKGSTPNRLHGTEVGYFKRDENIIESINALPDDALGIMESTANGVGNWFEKTFMEAWIAWKKGEPTTWYPIFHPWFQDPNNRLPSAEGLRLKYETELRDLAAKLQEREGILLTDEQLLWWDRRKQDNYDLVYQFYPWWPEQAFLHSGRPVFNLEVVAALAAKYGAPPKRRDGWIEIWEEANPKHHYGIGVDTAEGLEHGDNAVASVVCQETGQQVAEAAGKMAPHVLAQVVGKLARLYPNHLCVPERNNHGHAFILMAKEDEAINLYQRQVKDRITEKTETVIGWDTNQKSKAQVIAILGRDLEDGKCIPRSPECFEECRTYVHGERGKMGGMPGKKDDRVIGLALAHFGATETVSLGSLSLADYGIY
jgi:hypothetical protein